MDEPTKIQQRHHGRKTTDRLGAREELAHLPDPIERRMLLLLLPLFVTASVVGWAIAEFNGTTSWRENYILIPLAIVSFTTFVVVAAGRAIQFCRYFTLAFSMLVVTGWLLNMLWELAVNGFREDIYFDMSPWVILQSAMFIFLLRSKWGWILAFGYFGVSASAVLVFLFVNDSPLPVFVQGEIFLNYLIAHPVFLTLLLMFTSLRARFVREQTHSDDLRQLALQDGLTRLPNRRAFRVSFKRAKSRQIRFKTPLSVILLDIDRFKRVNDTYGHQVGDEVLVGLAELLTRYLRGSDEVFRWGGEEFMMLLPETDLNGALEVAERLRQAIESAPLLEKATITSSLGVTEVMPEEAEEDAFNRADKALYVAKRDGRNRVEAAPSPLAGRSL